MNYRIMYALGITPWERMAHPQAPVGEQISRLFAREESDRQQPFGRALDVGCGSGIWAVKLAQRGWDVTGIDFVSKAVRRARKRAEEAGVDANFVQGDATTLTAGVGDGFRFILDFGCFHDALTDEQRAAEGREVTAVAAADAALLMIAWTPVRRRMLPRGAKPERHRGGLPRVEGGRRGGRRHDRCPRLRPEGRAALLSA